MRLKMLILVYLLSVVTATHPMRKHNEERSYFGGLPSRMLDSSMVVSRPPPDLSSNDDQFHISRLERVRFGARARALTRPSSSPLVADSPTVPHNDECKYKKESWDECDPSTNTQKRRLVLKKGNPTCEPTKEIVRNCKAKPGAAKTPKTVVCRYKKGTWSECNSHSGLKTRTDTIKMSKHSNQAQVNANCEPTRVMTKKCKATKLGCKYNRSATWSDCDTRTNLRTKVLNLEGGSSTDCEPERRVTKTCRMSKGRKNQNKHDEVEEDEEEDRK